jgi:hypothetical protein
MGVSYPTFRAQAPATLPRFRTTPEDAADLAVERARQLQGGGRAVAFADGATLPRFNVEDARAVPPPEGESLPRWNVDRTPEGDEQLTGEGGAELAARESAARLPGSKALESVDGSTPAPQPPPGSSVSNRTPGVSPDLPGMRTAAMLETTPTGDARLTGAGGAELGARQLSPTSDPAGPVPASSGPAVARPGRTKTPPDRSAFDLSTPEGARGYVDALRNYDPHDHNGRVKSFLIGLGRGFLRGGISGALVSGVAHAIEPSLDEREAQSRNMGDAAGAEAAATQRSAATSRLADDASRRDYEAAQADYTRTQKPLNDAARREDGAKRVLLAQLGRMPTVDPERDKAFVRQWQSTFGDAFDVDAYNNKKGNFVVRGLVTDPSKPQEKHDVAFNFATGEQRDLGLSDYVVTRDAQGLSEGERRTDADRDASRVNLERQRSVSNELARAGLGIAQGHLALAGQGLDLRKLELDQRLSEQTRGELKDANKLLSEANGAQAEADDYADKGWYVGDDGQKHRAKWAVKAETDATNKAEALRQQFYGNYSYLWGGKMTRLQFSKNHPELMDSSEGSKFHSNRQIDEMARRYGIEIVPDDSPIETAPSVGNSLPRRSAPAAGRAAAPAASGRYAGQRMPAANLPAAAKALGMGEAQAKAYIESQGGVIY